MIKKMRILPVFIAVCTMFVGMRIAGFAAIGQTGAPAEPAAARDRGGQVQLGRNTAGLSIERDQVDPLGHIRPRDEIISETEAEIVERMARRRSEIDAQSRDIDARQEVLRAAEVQIDAKITKLQELEAHLKTLMNLYDEKENNRINSLVRIYGNMRPKDAARILDDLEMPVLLAIFERMNENRSAPIMAAMNQERARALTLEIAAKRPLSGI
ncbi:MAG: hypothetical protein FWF01_01705 [Alphaproteobacteria bacterium]|nr:hypothetical protein [Alphaproteobacteria bacterium]